MKKVIAFILTICILFTCAYSFSYIKAKSPQTEGLTDAQKEYLIAYVNYYVQQSQALDATVYDSTDSLGYRNTYTQNDGSDLPRGYSGTNRAGRSYSGKLVLVCSVFTAAMLHQALGANVEYIPPDSDTPSYRGSGYANPSNKNSDGQTYFRKVEANEYLEVGDVISGSGYAQHSMLYLGYDETRGGHVIAETGGSKTIQIIKMKGIPTTQGSNPITLAQVRQWGGYMESYPDTLQYGEASRLNPEILPENWTAPNKITIKWQTGITETDFKSSYEHDHEWEYSYDSANKTIHTKTCRICKEEQQEDCVFSYTSINDRKHNAKCICEREFEEEHTFENKICTKCNFEKVEPEPTQEPPKLLKGDVNLDGTITPTDILMVKRHIVEMIALTGDNFKNADIDEDEIVGGTDLIK